MRARMVFSTAFGAACALTSGACDDPSGSGGPVGTGPSQSIECSIPTRDILDGGPGKDGIPALNNPPMVANGHADIGYLQDSDRVIGLAWNGTAIAVPLNIGWRHEIVNLEVDGLPVAITHCPLTGSSLAFNRGSVDDATFGVSGLLFQNNLIMFDRNQPESLWPQMARGARCGARDGVALSMVPAIEMRWDGWRTLYPETRVVAGRPGVNYHRNGYPYLGGDYDRPGNQALLFPMPQAPDGRRLLKERVLGVPDAAGGIAFPFGSLDALGPAGALHGTLSDGSAFVVLWNRAHQSAMAYRPFAGGEMLTFEVRDGAVVDIETGSAWDVDGWSRSGALEGEHLEPIAEAYTAFWFAWAAFQPETQLWTGDVAT